MGRWPACLTAPACFGRLARTNKPRGSGHRGPLTQVFGVDRFDPWRPTNSRSPVAENGFRRWPHAPAPSASRSDSTHLSLVRVSMTLPPRGPERAVFRSLDPYARDISRSRSTTSSTCVRKRFSPSETRRRAVTRWPHDSRMDVAMARISWSRSMIRTLSSGPRPASLAEPRTGEGAAGLGAASSRAPLF